MFLSVLMCSELRRLNIQKVFSCCHQTTDHTSLTHTCARAHTQYTVTDSYVRMVSAMRKVSGLALIHRHEFLLHMWVCEWVIMIKSGSRVWKITQTLTHTHCEASLSGAVWWLIQPTPPLPLVPEYRNQQIPNNWVQWQNDIQWKFTCDSAASVLFWHFIPLFLIFLIHSLICFWRPGAVHWQRSDG